MIHTRAFPSTAPHYAGRRVFDTDATLTAFAENLGGVYSWGTSGNVRKCLTKKGVLIGAQKTGEGRWLAVSSTTPQPFDGIYGLDGQMIEPITSWAFFGSS
jgi:hypothetical protein